MVVKTFCDQCGQEMNTNPASGVAPQISLAIQSPTPQTSPNLCSYECTVAWLNARKAKDVKNNAVLVTPAGGAAPATPVTPM
jgi:hypothetical protein